VRRFHSFRRTCGVHEEFCRGTPSVFFGFFENFIFRCFFGFDLSPSALHRFYFCPLDFVPSVAGVVVAFFAFKRVRAQDPFLLGASNPSLIGACLGRPRPPLFGFRFLFVGPRNLHLSQMRLSFCRVCFFFFATCVFLG